MLESTKSINKVHIYPKKCNKQLKALLLLPSLLITQFWYSSLRVYSFSVPNFSNKCVDMNLETMSLQKMNEKSWQNSEFETETNWNEIEKHIKRDK